MELKTALEIIEYHQEWRLGKREDMIHKPKMLTQALDIVLNEVKECHLDNVSKQMELLVSFNKEMAKLHSWFLPAEDSMINEFLSNK